MNEGNVEPLLAAIQDGKPWMNRFTGKGYGSAFEEYCARFGPLCREVALREGEEGLSALAEVLLDGLETGWRRRRPWNRSLAKVEDRQMLVCYFSPMLLEDPLCAPLAEKLREGWAARWPKDAYQTATKKELQRGFRNSILGIPLGDWGRKTDEEA